MSEYDVVIIGGGQSGLATGYYMRRQGLNYLILDAHAEAGGAWQKAWDSLTLFSQAQSSSLPGTMFPGKEIYPSKNQVIEYLGAYETKYQLPVRRPVTVHQVTQKENRFYLDTNQGAIISRAIINATGSWQKPYIPDLPGMEEFEGISLHSATYKVPAPYTHKKVLVVGEGNSGAQIMAEVSEVAKATWATSKPPVFLPDHVDGAYLFNQATAKYKAQQAGETFKPASLGDIVVVPAVKRARMEGRLDYRTGLVGLTKEGVIWESGEQQAFDVIIWCTGFRPALDHLCPLGLNTNSKPALQGNMSAEVPGVWFVGYGNWTGFASATLIGVGRSASKTVKEVAAWLADH